MMARFQGLIPGYGTLACWVICPLVSSRWARASGYRAIQFNAVAETNRGAVALWRALGFEVVGTVREAFEHPSHGYVALLIMHRFV